MKYLKRCKKPLSLLLIVSLILSLVPVVPINIAKADNYDGIRDNIYTGGFDNYKGVSRKNCMDSYNISDKTTTKDRRTLYLNVEATIDRKQAIYGTPEDVPGNFVSYQAGFKAVANGYFYATQTNGVWHLKTSGTRGYFRYIGYDVNGNVISDQQFPPDVAGGYIPVSASTQLVATPWNNATAKQICSVANNYNKPDSPIYDQAFNNIDSLKDERGNSLGQALSTMGKTKADFSNSAMILNQAGKYTASVVLVLIDNGVMHYRTYTGPVNKAKPQVTSDSITIGIDSQSYLLNAGTDSYKYNPTTQKDPSFTVTITGTMIDYYTAKTNDGGYYKAFNYTREDVTKYTTIINYVKVNGTEINVTKEYVDANISETQADKIIFKTATPSQVRVTIPKNLLQQGTNTITMAGKTRVYFDNGQWADAGNSASKTITVINDYKPATPTLKLNVTPTPTEVSISNGTYNPTNIQHNIGATVSVGNVPQSYKIGDMEFKIDTSNNVDSTIPISKAINNTSPNNTLNNITYFNFDTTKITKKSTPAYYGKVRYSLVNTSNPSEVWWSNWSSLASTNAEVNLKIAQGDLTGTLSNNDKIALDSNGNVKGTSSKNFTASFTVTGSLSDTGNKTIKNWSVIIYHTNGTESQTYTISSTSKSIIASNKQLVITTDKNKSAENFVADVIVNFTDNTNKKVQTNPVSIPVEIEGDSNITLNFSGSKSTLSGKVGDTVSVTLNADSKVTTTKNVTNYSIWIRKSDESLSSPTNSTTSNIKNLSASKPYSFKLTKNMNNTTVSFIARAKATLNDGTILDSGQKTFTVTLIVSDNPPPVSDNPPSSVNCNGSISPTSASATKNPFTGVIDPPTTSVQVGVSASVDAGSKTVSRWELYCDNDLLTTINGNNTSVSAPLGTKTYTVSNDGTRTFNFKAKVYFTDGSTLEGTDTKVFGATQQEIPNNPPSVTIAAVPNVVPQGDDSFIVASATDPDLQNGDSITINKSVNGGNFDGSYFWSNTIGTYIATAVATDSKGLSSSANTTISVIPAIPTPRLKTSGTLKENRKVILDGSYSNAGSKRATIDWTNATWTITPTDSSIPQSDIKVIENLTGSQKLTTLFKTAGKYKVTLTIKNNYGNQQTGTWYIDIQPDKLPVVDFTMPTKVIRDPADSSKATIQITSNSFSPDGDTIAKHAWFYAYDSNNDGNFDNETWYIRKSDGTWQTVGDYTAVQNYDVENFDSGNNSNINLKVDKVGKYKIELVCREEFGQETLSQFVTGYDRRRNNTFEQDEEKKVSEVINVAPYATLGSSKIDKKKVNLNILTDKTDTASINAIKSKLDNFKSDLYSYGVDVNYNIVDGSNKLSKVKFATDIEPTGLPLTPQTWKIKGDTGSYHSVDFTRISPLYGNNFIPLGIVTVGYSGGPAYYDSDGHVFTCLYRDTINNCWYIGDNGWVWGRPQVTYPLCNANIKKIVANHLFCDSDNWGTRYYILFDNGYLYAVNDYSYYSATLNSNVINQYHTLGVNLIATNVKDVSFGVTVSTQYNYVISWSGNGIPNLGTQSDFVGAVFYITNDGKLFSEYRKIIQSDSSKIPYPYDTMQPLLDKFFTLATFNGASNGTMVQIPLPRPAIMLGSNYVILDNGDVYYPNALYRKQYWPLSEIGSITTAYNVPVYAGNIQIPNNINRIDGMYYRTIKTVPITIGSTKEYFSYIIPTNAPDYYSTKDVLIYNDRVEVLDVGSGGFSRVWSCPKEKYLVPFCYYDNGNIHDDRYNYTINNVTVLFTDNETIYYMENSTGKIYAYFRYCNRYSNDGRYLIAQATTSSIDTLNYNPLLSFDEKSDNYGIYLSDGTGGDYTKPFGQYFSFSAIDKVFLSNLIHSNSKFYSVTPSANFNYIMPETTQEVTLQQLANATDGRLYDSAGNATAQLDQALADIKAKYTNNTPKNEVYVLADEQQVQYYPYQDDYEGDFIFNQRWKYKHITADNVQNQSVFTCNAESNDIGQLYGSTYGPPGTLEIDTTNKYEGTSSAKVYTQNNYTGGLFIKSPAIQVGKGFTFTITAYVKYTSGKQISLTAIVGDSSGGEWFTLQSNTITANGSWQQISITATNNTSDYIKVLISYSNATAYEYGWADAISVIRSGSVPIFDNPNGTLPQNDTWLNSPIDTFSQVGKYLVTYQVQDSPPPMDDSNFDEYRQWSKLEDQLTIYVHRRPIADFTVVKNASNKLVITDRSYDLDHQYNRADKGIINRKWQYKTIDDSTWTDTTLSNLQNMTLLSNKIYLIKLEVQDCDGINGVGEWSKPNIQIVDTTIANNPPVAQFDIQNQIKQGTQPVIADNSYDPDNDTITTWHWWIYNSDNTVNKDFAEVGNNNIAFYVGYIATLGVGNYIAKLQVKDSAGNYSAIASKNFTIYTDTQQPEATNNAPTGTFVMTITDFRTKLKPTTTYTDPDSDPKNSEQWSITFNGQTKYYDKLPDTLESAGYTFDGTYRIGYRVQDNPTARNSKLKPLWSEWFYQNYVINSDITIQAWTEKIAKRAHRKSEVDLTTKKTSTVLIGEGITVKAKTTGYVYKIDAWFDRVDTVVYTPNRTPVTKTIVGYWECNIKAKTASESMVLTNIHTKLDPVKNFTQTPNSMDWSSDVLDRKLQVRFIINHDNSFVRNNDYSEGLGWGDQAKNLWEGVYCWSDWPLSQYSTFNKDKAMAMYGRVPYFKIGDKLWIKVRAYKKNADGTDTTKDVDLPITINGSLVIQAGF